MKKNNAYITIVYIFFINNIFNSQVSTCGEEQFEVVIYDTWLI